MKWMAVLLLFAPAAFAAEDTRVSFLEQEVRNLHRQVDALSRQVESLSTRPERPGTGPAAPEKSLPASPTQWVDAARWRKIRPGMSEREVIGTLGPPTSMREENGMRVLLYALEIGPSAFLAGSVAFRDRAVAEVRQPVLQ
jgi:hypothetical protein